MNAAAVDECRAQLAAAQRCYHKKLDELNARLTRQTVDRQVLDERREACFQQLQQESRLIRCQLQARAYVVQPRGSNKFSKNVVERPHRRFVTPRSFEWICLILTAT